MTTQKQTPVASGGEVLERPCQVIAPLHVQSDPATRQALDHFRETVVLDKIVLPAEVVAGEKIRICRIGSGTRSGDGGNPQPELVVSVDDDHTEDNPGLIKTKETVVAVGCHVVPPDSGEDQLDGATNSDTLAQGCSIETTEFLEVFPTEDPESIPEPTSEAEFKSILDAVKHLSDMHPLAYEQIRVAEAKQLKIRATELDKYVLEARKARKDATGMSTMFPDIEPWPDPVDLALLLDEICATFRQFIICDDSTSVAASLWVAFTWCIDNVQVAPLLAITAPEKRCGKSQLLDVVGRLSNRPLVASNISSAAVFRVIEAHCPTLLIDEADSFMKENEELRGIINSGHTRQSAYVIRTTGDDHEPRQFSTWGAKAISGIGHLAGTLMDRAVVLTLRRKLATEKCSRLRHAPPETFKRLASMLARFAVDSAPSIGEARPDLPEELNDRAQDNWEALLAIADHAGGEWPKLARAAALNLSGSEQETASTSTELLSDIRDIFITKAKERLPSTDLLDALIADDTKPWASYTYGKPMSPRQLAKRLGEFGISPKDAKIHGVSRKCYQKSQLDDVFERYLPSDPLNPPQPATFECQSDSSGFGSVAVADERATDRGPVADQSAIRDQSATLRTAPAVVVAVVADSGGSAREVVGLRINGRRAV